MSIFNLKTQASPFVSRVITGAILSALVIGITCWAPPFIFSFFIYLIMMLIITQELPRFIKNPRNTQSPFFPRPAFLGAALVLSVPFILLLQLHRLSPLLTLLAIFTTSAFDTGAYLIGKWCGKHKLCPKISPNKTWEGFLGGYLFVIGFLATWKLIHGATIDWIHIGPLAMAISIIATLGDLIESWAKRRAKIKDSGTLLPGHGGILDRIDSLLATVFLWYFGYFWLANALL